MKISCRVDGSVCGAALVTLPSASLSKAHATRRSLRTTTLDAAPEPPRSAPGRVSVCAKSSLWLLSTFRLAGEPRRPTPSPRSRLGWQSYYSTATAAAPSAARSQLQRNSPPSAQEKHRLLSLVNIMDEGTVQEHFDYYRDPYRRGYAFSDGPYLRVSDRRLDVEYPVQDDMSNPDDDMQRLLARLNVAIRQRLRHPKRVSLEFLYKLYCQLPEPRMLLLTWQWRDKLLRVMGTPPKRDLQSMLRYFALVADVKNAGLTLRRSQWNFGLAFAAKYTSRPTAQEMESMLRLWREMELDAKVPGNDVTFNILFDVAAKAGNFTLADMIYQEMESRGIEFNRYHHVSLIYYFGLKLDSGGIRAAYKEMVESGEMIDTVVLNCVIAGLLRCGEEASVDEMYKRMTAVCTPAVVTPKRDYLINKVVSRVLRMFARTTKKHPELKQKLQASVRLAPNLDTYKLLVRHYAIRVGNLNRTAQYLDEMKHLKAPVHPTIFLALFKGFYAHGGFAGSDWSKQRLHGVLLVLYQTHDAHAKEFRIGCWLVIWALRAVKKCSTREAVVQAFDAMAQRWDIRHDRQPFMYDIFDNILQGKDMRSTGGVLERRNA